MPYEIELKLDVQPAQLVGLARAGWLRRLVTGPGADRRLESTYYDTDALTLRDHRALLRVRKSEGSYTQTFKTQDAGGGLRRLEWECPVKGARPCFKHAGKKKTGGFDLRKLADTLKPVFETDVRRRTLPLHFRGSEIELALDKGQVKTDHWRAPIHEIELELKRGNRASIIALGRQIADKLGAGYGVFSKAERGYALRENGSEYRICAESVLLSDDMTVGEAFQAIAMACVHHFAGNEKAILAGQAEGVHQMRVGLRRLRAALSIFKKALRGPETEAIKSSLEWLTEELGPARDLDVMVKEAIVPMVEISPAPEAVVALKSDVVAKKNKGFARARRAVTSERYCRVVLDTVFWINGGRWITSRGKLMASCRDASALHFASRELARRTKKALKKLRKLHRLTPPKRHKLRITIKKLRYACGYFESLFGARKAAERFSIALKELQSSLGQLNDIRIYSELARDYAAPPVATRGAAERAFAMGELIGSERAQSQRLLKAVKRRGGRLKHSTAFWT